MTQEPSNQLPRKTRLVLVDLLAHASSAARIVGHLEDSDDSNLEQLSDHVDALVHGLSELFGEHRPTTKPAPGEEEPDLADELRERLETADALAWTTDEQFKRVVVIEDGDDRQGLKRLGHLVELTAMAVSAASKASSELIATLQPAPSQERA
jgi:hypothetical protein